MKILDKIRIYTRGFFEEGSYKNFLLHDFLFLSNIFLFFVLIMELFFIKDIYYLHIIHNTELFFGLIYSVEFVLRLIYVYLPNKIYFKPYLILNFLVILSLVVPQIFGNIAFLRLVRSLKMIKIYILRKKQKKDLLNNPDFKDATKLVQEKIKNIKHDFS